MASFKQSLRLKQLGIDTYKEAVIYMHKDCHVCRAEGFDVHARIRVEIGKRSILATLNTIENNILAPMEASLSKYAWELLNAKEGDRIILSHPEPLPSLSDVRSKIYGHPLSLPQIERIIQDIAKGSYSDIHIAAFLTACSGGRLATDEVTILTKTMVDVGARLNWPSDMVVDKHCVGGLPGNRTSLIIVPIVSAFGLTMPKTSSRAITSPAGTADTMEVLAPVDLDLSKMRKVVEQEQGCIVWGGGAALSPADDILIRVERVLDLDSEGQLVASVLSKKIAAGSSHVVIDIPIGPTAKVRSKKMANVLKMFFEAVAKQLGLTLKIIFSDGTQPVGRGIGPALEARDVLAVLQRDNDAPKDLRDRALTLAGTILEFSSKVKSGQGRREAETILESGKAWQKFQAICQAQGGMRIPQIAKYQYEVISKRAGKVTKIDNRLLARIAKLAGAPQDKTAGVMLQVSLGEAVEHNQPLFTIHADSKGALDYALTLLKQEQVIIQVGASP